MKRLIPGLLTAAACLPAVAADPLHEEGFSVRFEGFRSSAETRLRIDSSTGALGTSVSLEDDLGFARNKSLPAVDAVWRINPRHRIELGYVRLARDAQKTISGEIRFGDSVFPVNADVNSAFDSDVWRLAYGWSFYRDGGSELALLVGLHVTGFEARLQTRGGVAAIAESADRTIPLPTIGLQGAWAFSPEWKLTAWGQYFSLKYGDYDGSLFNGSLGAEYRINRNFALGAGYTVYDYNLDVTKGRARGSFDYNFAGPMVYLTAGF